MTIRKIIRKSLETILIVSPLIASGFGFANLYNDRREVVKKLGWETNTTGAVTYSLLADGNILARQHFISKFGMFAPSNYEITKDNPRYQKIIDGRINGN